MQADLLATGTPETGPTVRSITVDRTMDWIKRGWIDFKATPTVSLILGSYFVIASWALSVGLADAGLGSLIPAFAGGFLLVAPLLAVAFYEVARHLEAGEPVVLGEVIGGAFRRPGRLAAMGLLLSLAFLAWMQVAVVLFAGFFGQSPPALETFFVDILTAPQGPAFLAAGSLAGCILGGIVFTITAISIPMIQDRPVDLLTAVRTSIRAVTLNPGSMMGWALNIAFIAATGFATFFVGLAVAMPVLGYATWHAYRDLVETGD